MVHVAKNRWRARGGGSSITPHLGRKRTVCSQYPPELMDVIKSSCQLRVSVLLLWIPILRMEVARNEDSPWIKVYTSTLRRNHQLLAIKHAQKPPKLNFSVVFVDDYVRDAIVTIIPLVTPTEKRVWRTLMRKIRLVPVWPQNTVTSGSIRGSLSRQVFCTYWRPR